MSIVTASYVPQRRTCGAMAVHMRLLDTAAGFREAQRALESATGRRMASPDAARRTTGPVTIPIIVHVVFQTDEQNIPEEQIRTQLDILNADFNGQNADRKKTPAVWEGLIASADIRFELTDVTRTQTDVAAFPADDSVKFAGTGGHDAAPADKFLNIWVCQLGSGLLGYAQFPGGPALTDGVVILHSAFGTTGTATSPFHLGRTATHEVGHWLNLRHIWGDTEDCSGTDFVADTPNAAGPNYGTPNFPSISCNNGPHGDMFMNYMDYVNDESMFMFTPQQVVRMQATLDGPRNTIGR